MLSRLQRWRAGGGRPDANGDRHLGKNIVIVAALMGLGFFAAWLRFRPYLGSEGQFTDGQQAYDRVHDSDVRYAIWDTPVRLPQGVNGPEGESRPSLSPDGRFLVYAVGERGLGSDLYIAEMVEGVPVDPAPLASLNTSADELAPCFSGGSLWFSSDRPGTAGGLDLHRAAYDRGVFGPVERVLGGVNSDADDTDPAPVPGELDLVFASNRDTLGSLEDFQLYRASPAAEATQGPVEEPAGQAWSVEALVPLNSAYQEREPAFTADGRTLFFASNRAGGAGSYDLYRSTFSEAEGPGQWLAPEPLVGVNTPGGERGPSPSRDGFSLLLTVDGMADEGEQSAAADLFRAHSLELFRNPGPPVGLTEILILLALAALAVLAWLAKRWEQLEVVYKCFLVSIIAHLLLMGYFREVYPEGQDYVLHDGDSRIRMRLVASQSVASQARNEERSGALEVARAEGATEAQPATRFTVAADPLETDAAPAEAKLERVDQVAPQQPERMETGDVAPDAIADQAARGRANRADLLRDTETLARRFGTAPSISVESAKTAAHGQRQAADSPGRERQSLANLDSGGPSLSALGRSTRADQPSAPAAERVELRQGALGRITQSSPVLLAPTAEAFARRSGVVESLAVESANTGGRGKRSEPSLRDGSLTAADTLSLASHSDASAAAPLQRGAERKFDVSQKIEFEEWNRPSQEMGVRTDLQIPTQNTEAGARSGVAQHDLLESLPQNPALRSREGESFELQAKGGFARPDLSMDLTPEPRGLDVADRRAQGSLGTPLRKKLLAHPEGAESGTRVALEAAVESPRTVALPASESGDRGEALEDLLAGMVTDAVLAPPARNRVPSGGGLEGPQRFHSVMGLPDQGPRLEPLRSPRRELQEGLTPVIARWDHTPYQSRSGDRKTHALDLHGGTVETEAAVAAGLAYLARLQNPAGYWGSPRDLDEKYGRVAIGKTGLCLLAFLGAGHTQVPIDGAPDSEYSHAVGKAIDFLLAIQDSRGHFGDTSSYGNAVATYALAEAFALTADTRLRRPLERAIEHIQGKQMHSRDPRFNGGWGYYYPDARSFDRWPRVSVTAWQVMALESAQLGGLTVNAQVFSDAHGFLTSAWDERHRAYRYNHDPSRLSSNYPILPGSTPAALFALSLLGEDIASSEFNSARRFVLQKAPQRYADQGDDAFIFNASGNLYFWYYGTLSLFRMGGTAWKQWNTAMQECLLPSQQPDGSWRPISVYAEYAADSNSDRSYTTAMCVLTLEVYYRYFTPLLKVK